MASTTQIFLKLTMARGNSIAGEASAAGYEGLIELDSFGFSMSAKQSLRQEAGKVRSMVDCDRVKCSKVYDVASVPLASHLNGRIKFTTAEIFVDHHLHEASAKDRNPIMVIKLSDGYIADIRLSVSEGKLASTVKEDFSLSYLNFSITYFPGTEGRERRGAAVEFETSYEEV